jgi:hypothetical protein
VNLLYYQGIVVSDLFLSKHPHMLWHMGRFNQCLFFRQRLINYEEMAGIWMEGRSYAQVYPPKLGRGFCEYFS